MTMTTTTPSSMQHFKFIETTRLRVKFIFDIVINVYGTPVFTQIYSMSKNNSKYMGLTRMYYVLLVCTMFYTLISNQVVMIML